MLKRSLAGIGLCVLMAGCNSGGEGFSFAPRDGSAREGAQEGPVVPTLRKAELARGAVTLKAPKGYCIDATSVSGGLQGSSALLARCSSLEGKGAGADAAVMTVNVSPRRGAVGAAPTPDDLATALAPTPILARKQRGQLALVQVGAGGDTLFAPADPVHWRGATALDTRLVLLGLYAPNGSALSGAAGADLLSTLAKGLSASRGTFLGVKPNNPDAATPTETQPEAATQLPATDKVEAEKKGLGKLIGRLLNRS